MKIGFLLFVLSQNSRPVAYICRTVAVSVIPSLVRPPEHALTTEHISSIWPTGITSFPYQSRIVFSVGLPTRSDRSPILSSVLFLFPLLLYTITKKSQHFFQKLFNIPKSFLRNADDRLFGRVFGADVRVEFFLRDK